MSKLPKIGRRKESMSNLVSNTVADFKDFLNKQNVVGVAVGLAVGGAVSTLATSLINNVVMVPVGYLFGSPDGLKGIMIELGVKKGQAVMWPIGTFLADLVNFLIILLVFYMVIKMFKLDRTK